MKLRTILIMAAALIALVVVFFIVSRPAAPPPEELRPFVWKIETDELRKIAITLPKEGKSEVWVRHDDQYFYFDQPDGPKVNMRRWGGGIPLLLSGPGANRLIAEEATDEQLKVYGLDDPKMRMALTLDNGDTINIEVGDRTPDQKSYYIKHVGSRKIFTVDYTWYDVLERLVLAPPYPEPDEK